MVTEMRVKAVGFIPSMHEFAVILVDPENDEALTIAITPFEAKALRLELNHAPLHRPTTHALMRNILGAFDAEIVRIEMIDLKDNTYYATIHFVSGEKTFTMDSRPSDAIAIAVRSHAPIYVEDKVIQKSKTGEDVSEILDKSKEGKKWAEYLEKLNPEDFGKYKM